MPSTKVKALVLGAKDSKEKDKLVTLYTLEQGKMTCSLRGVKGEKAKLKFAKEPFCFGEYIIENTRGIDIVTQVEVIDTFFDLTKNIEKFYEGCAIIDIVNKLASSQSDPAFFIEIINALKTICYSDVRGSQTLNKFLIKVFSNMGYSFMAKQCSSCKAELSARRYFNLDIGEFVCSACKNDTCLLVSDGVYNALKILSTTPYEKLPTVKLDTQVAEETFLLLNKNFQWRFSAKVNYLSV